MVLKRLLILLPFVAAVVPGRRLPELARSVASCDFALYGDCRGGGDTHRRLCALMVKSGAKFVINTGDLVRYEKWAEFREITRELRSGAEYLSAVGDHDRTPPGEFLRELGLDGYRFDRRIGDLHFFFLDSAEAAATPEQLAWLEETASRSGALHKIAVFHHTPFTLMARRTDEAEATRKIFHERLVRLKFCAAFCGHLHAFYTTRRDGIRYVVSGGGGAFPHPLDSGLAAAEDGWREFFHFVGFRMEKSRIAARVFDDYGTEAFDLAFTLCDHAGS